MRRKFWGTKIMSASISYEIVTPTKHKGVPCNAPSSFIKSMNEAFGGGVEQTEWYLDKDSIPYLAGMAIMAGDKEPYNFLIEKIRKHGEIRVSYQY